MICFFPKAAPRYMSIFTKIAVTNITLPLVFSYHFWRTWGDVIEPNCERTVK